MSDARNMLRSNDIRFLEFARSLTDQEWSRPSLCAEWTNHEVLAHLVVGYRASVTALVVGMARHGGSFDRANVALAVDVARQHHPTELVAEFATLIDHPRGIGRAFPRRLLLGDHVIHELDIAFALGRQSEVAPDALVAVLNTQVRVPNPFVPAAARARGLSLSATDADWSYGRGPHQVTGAAADLASVLAGRQSQLDQLSGDGVATLGSRL